MKLLAISVLNQRKRIQTNPSLNLIGIAIFVSLIFVRCVHSYIANLPRVHKKNKSLTQRKRSSAFNAMVRRKVSV